MTILTETFVDSDALACTRAVSRLHNAARVLAEHGNDNTASTLEQLAEWMNPRRPGTGMADAARALLGDPLAVDQADEADRDQAVQR